MHHKITLYTSHIITSIIAVMMVLLGIQMFLRNEITILSLLLMILTPYLIHFVVSTGFMLVKLKKEKDK